ncbi:MAG: right-handed parallel beta-helix repeat-containing protein, partial [Bacteroidota bacterium]
MKKTLRICVVAVLAVLGSYSLNAALSGDYYVGTGSAPAGAQTYASLSAAFTALNSGGVSGNVTLWLTSDQTTTTSLTLNDLSGSGTVYIRPYQEERKITGSVSSNGILVFNGTDDIIIDGSLSGSDRSLTIQNNTSGTAIYFKASSTGSYCEDFAVKNCIVKAGAPGSSNTNNIAIAIMGTTPTSTGYNHRRGLIENNEINHAYYGIRAYAQSSYKYLDMVYKNNIIGDPETPNYTGGNNLYYGLYMFYHQNAEVVGNDFWGTYYPLYESYGYGDIYIKENSFKDFRGYVRIAYNYDNLYIQDNFVKSREDYSYQGLYIFYTQNTASEDFIISGNEVIGGDDYYGIYIYRGTNLQMYDNYIHDQTDEYTGYLCAVYLNQVSSGAFYNNRIEDITNTSTSTSGGSAWGLHMIGGTSSTTVYTNGFKIHSNFFKNIKSNGNNGTGTYFIRNPIAINIWGGNDISVYQNTVDMGTSFLPNSKNGAYSACLSVSYYRITAAKVANNIFRNYMIGNGTLAYGIYVNPYYGDINFTEIDDNVYDFSVAGASGRVIKWGAADYAFLTNWTDFSGADVNSAQTEVFLMADGHLDGGSLGDEGLDCAKKPGIDYDMDGELRQSTTTAGIDVAEMQPISLTQDMLMDPPSGSVVCPGDQVSMGFEGGTTFADGINRNVSTAMNYTWYFRDEDGNTSVLNPLNNPNIIISFNNLEITEAELENAGSYWARISYPGLEDVYTSEVQLGVTEPLYMTSQPMPTYEGCVGKGEIIMQVGAEN